MNTVDTTGYVAGIDLDQVRGRLVGSPRGMLTPHRVAEVLRELGRPVGDSVVLSVYEALRASANSTGDPVLDDLLETSDRVVIKGTTATWMDASGVVDSATVFGGVAEKSRRFAQCMASRAGERLDDAQPYCDVRLTNGTRMKASLAAHGLPTAIELIPNATYTLDERVALGMLTPQAAELHRSVDALVSAAGE